MGWAVEGRRLQLVLASALLFIAATRTAAVASGGIIDTVAGGGIGDGFPAAIASVDPDGVSVGPDGSTYIAESSRHRIRRVDPQSGFIETFAGIGSAGFAGDGGQAVVARLSYPTSAVADASGNVYICDQSNHRIRRVSPNGTITTVAGSGVAGFADGPATAAKLYFPRSLSVDSAGNVLIAEPFNQRVRYLNVATATLSTIAGNGTGGYSGDNISATQAKLQLPAGVWSLAGGAFLIADQGNNRIRKVDSGGVIHTVAGTGTNGFSGDGSQATAAMLSSPAATSARADGSIAIADQGNHRLRVVSPSGVITTVAGTGAAGYNGDSIPGAQAQLNRPSSVAFTAQADCVIADLDNNRIRSLDNCSGNGTITTLAGIPASFTGDGWPALAAVLSGPTGVAQDSSGNVYIADSGANRVRRIGTDGLIATVAGTGQAGFSGDGGPATQAQLRQPYRVALDPQGNLLVLDTGNKRLRRVNASDGTITTIAGTGVSGSGGDTGPALNASFVFPQGLAVDAAGRVYIADASGRRIRMIDQAGRISTIAGTGVATGSIDGPGGNAADDLGDLGPAVLATFVAPSDVAVDSLGNVYVTDMTAHLVRRIDAGGVIRPVAGTGTGTGRVDGPGGDPSDDLGDGGPATRASVNTPVGVEVAPGGDIYIADQANRRIRIIHNGIISTLGGDGVVTWSLDGEGGDPSDDLGDGGAVAGATFMALSGIFADGQGNLLLADSQAARVRSVLISGSPPPPPPAPTQTFTRTPTSIPATATSVPATPTRTPTSVPATATRTPTSVPATPTRTATRTSTPAPAPVAVFGKVTYYTNNQVVPAVQVDLTGPTSQTVQTGTTGSYSATNIPAGTWSVVPDKVGGFGNAVSSLDAARVLQVIAGITTFTPLQRLACDVTGDGTLSALDAVRILQFSAGVISKLPVAQMCGSDWLFYPSATANTQVVPVPPSVSGGTCQQGNIQLRSLADPVSNQDFNAILFGDCTGNWTTSSGAALSELAPSAATVRAGALRRGPGTRVRVPIYVQMPAPFQALDVKIGYDAGALALRSVHPHGAAAKALIGVSNNQTGLVAVSLASAQQINSEGAVLVLEFAGDGRGTPVQLLAAQVDEQTARVATHASR